MPAWRGTFIVSVRRGVPVTPAEADWIIKSNAADPTSGSLRKATRFFARPKSLWLTRAG